MRSNQPDVRPEDDFLDLSKVSESDGSSKESAIEYIRESPLPFEIPPYEGDRYETWAPDTLDFAERAKLAINGLTGPTDPEADYEVYWQVNFFRDPPVMWHDVDDVQPKFMEALPLLRLICGSDYNDHVDEAWMRTLMRSIGPDGLVYMALKGRPWAKLYVGPDGYPHPIWRANGETTTIDDESVSQITHDWIAEGRLLSAMMVYYQRDGDEVWKDLVQKTVDRLSELDIHREGYSYYPEGSFEPNAKVDQNAEIPLGVKSGLAAGRLIQGLTHCYRFTGYQPALDLAGELVVYVKDHGAFFEEDATFIDATRDVIHFHDHAIDLLFMLEYAVEAGDGDLLEFVRKGYEFGRSHSSPTVGFFPELIEDTPIGNPYPKAARGCLVSETCEVADMIALALKMTRLGIGDYWDDADRWIRNQFAENQLMRVDWVDRIPKPQKRGLIAFHESDDRVAERNLGAFAGWPSANDWTIFGGIQHCCTGNGARALYYIWENILDCEDGMLKVHLLLNRASPWVDVDSHIPYEGRVDLKVKQRCDRVLVRVPEWIESGSDDVVCTINDRDSGFTWEGRYVDAGPADPDDKVAITFPIHERTVTEMIGCVLYTMVIKGNEVVFIDPPGKYHPLYQRAHYRENQTRWRKVNRFVTKEDLKW